VEIMTGIAVAFARSPLTLATAAHDLAVLSRGRFILGIGSQLKAHITRRYSMPFSHPARRMQELIQAVHAIWDCWYDGKPLDFRGEFYQHTLMTPYFTPPEKPPRRPAIHLAAVGPLMTDVAGEVADGLVGHPLTSERYLREVTIPRVEAGLKRSGRTRADFEISGSPFIACGDTAAALDKALAGVRHQVAFYGSTRAYRHVLDLHGWGELHERLHALSTQGRWSEMSALVNDEVLHTFALTGNARDVAAEIHRRFDGLYDRVSVTFDATAQQNAELIAIKK
jgi:probable F420-dependent oxidoreductase